MDIINNFLDTYSTEIIGGLLASIIVLLVGKLRDLEKNLHIRRIYSGYIGSYYLHSFASSGDDKITVYKVDIKASFGKLIAIADGRTTVKGKTIYSYKGSVDISERNIYINLNGVNHIEKIQLVFHSPLHRNIKNLVGAVSAITVIDEPFASICILSDKEIEEKEIKSEFEKLGVNYKNAMFKVPKDYTVFFGNIDKYEGKHTRKDSDISE